MRFDNRFNVQFSINGPLNGQLIPPMLLLPFVENAFKHSLEEENSAFIAIDLVLDTDGLSFKVENTIAKNEHSIQESGGIGLENVQKRLKLLWQAARKDSIKTIGTLASKFGSKIRYF